MSGGIKVSIRSHTPHVTNEKNYGQTFILSFTDMNGTVHRMNGRTHLVLSPQLLVDAQCDDVPTAIAFATQEHLGFESITKSPFIRISREVANWTENNYNVGPEMRYRIDDVKMFSGSEEIESAILANFGEGGSKYPIVGVLHSNEFKDRSVAAAAAADGALPFRKGAPLTPHLEGMRTRQVVLIVGVDTTSDDPLMHHCEVKGCHGVRWGIGGFSKVGFEAFEFVLVPYYG